MSLDSFKASLQMLNFLLTGWGTEYPSFSMSQQTSGQWCEWPGRFPFQHLPNRYAKEEARSSAAHGSLTERPWQPPHQSTQRVTGGLARSFVYIYSSTHVQFSSTLPPIRYTLIVPVGKFLLDSIECIIMLSQTW